MRTVYQEVDKLTSMINENSTSHYIHPPLSHDHVEFNFILELCYDMYKNKVMIILVDNIYSLCCKILATYILHGNVSLLSFVTDGMPFNANL